MMLEGPGHSESSDLSKSSNLQNLKLFLTQKVVLIRFTAKFHGGKRFKHEKKHVLHKNKMLKLKK